MSRRVVVTGVGLVSPLGIGTEDTWQARARAGKAESATISAFDASAFACQIAGEVKDFDPHKYIEKKEIKKMGRFIQFAIAASECALFEFRAEGGRGRTRSASASTSAAASADSM